MTCVLAILDQGNPALVGADSPRVHGAYRGGLGGSVGHYSNEDGSYNKEVFSYLRDVKAECKSGIKNYLQIPS